MKNLLIATLAITAMLSSCNQSSTKEAAVSSPLSPGCYEFTQNNTKILMHLETDAETVTGELVYDFYEKDDNRGSLVGTMQGDTLFAVYTFRSEGTESRREVAFLAEGDRLTEGYGNSREVDGVVTFEDRRNLDFSSGTVLTKTECPTDKVE